MFFFLFHISISPTFRHYAFIRDGFMRNALRSNIVKRITGVWNLHSHLTPKHSESLDSFSFAKRSSHCPTILHQNIFLSDLLIARPYYIKAFPFTQRSYIKEFKKFILRGCVPFVTFQIHVCFFLDCLILPVNIDHLDSVSGFQE